MISMRNVLESIQSYLDYYNVGITDVADLEFQVLASGEGGEPVEGRNHCWTDGVETWKHIRVPYRADTDPEFTDYVLDWRLDKHALAIGFTGWDWRNKQSKWVGFDIDSLVNHAEGIGLSEEGLKIVKEKLCELPYVHVCRSTSGNGLHAKVFLEDGIGTQNHNEHAAVARAIMGVMSTACGFDFSAAVDCAGSILWAWHRDASPEKGSFEVVKENETLFTKDDLPDNWKANLPVITRERGKVKLDGIDDNDEDFFDQMSAGRVRTPLSDVHKSHIETLKGYGGVLTWVPDHHLLQTHTAMLKKLHREQGLKGLFETHSQGKDLATANCFAMPADNDEWVVVRFGRSVREHGIWKTNANGWVTCKLNAEPTFDQAMEHGKGGLLGDSQGYCFHRVVECLSAIRSYGVEPFDVAAPLAERECSVFLDKSNNIVIQADKEKGDAGVAFAGWNSQMKKTKWSRVIRTDKEPDDGADIEGMDNLIRRCSLSDGQNIGWIATSNNQWKSITESEVNALSVSLGVEKGEVQEVKGKLFQQSWTIVNLPFKPEYPGGRLWNRDAPQLAFKPASRNDTDDSKHPHWDMILDHVGGSLDEGVREHKWCKAAGISSGRAYLTGWTASMIREPEAPLPYLFIYGQENCGKSIFHEAASLLLTKGAVKADRVLTGRDGFNAELEGCVLAIVEEVDVGNQRAHNRLKDLVTSPTLAIRAMRRNVYEVPNMTSWVQVANYRDSCLVPEGDSRITVIEVPPLTREIPKGILRSNLIKEAPHFLRTLLDFNLPEAAERLRVPVIETQAKFAAMQMNKNPIISFIEEMCHRVQGGSIPFKEFYTKFMETTPADLAASYKERTMRGQLPNEFPVGKIAGEGNQYFVGNLSFNAKEKPSSPWTAVGNKLTRESQ